MKTPTTGPCRPLNLVLPFLLLLLLSPSLQFKSNVVASAVFVGRHR